MGGDVTPTNCEEAPEALSPDIGIVLQAVMHSLQEFEQELSLATPESLVAAANRLAEAGEQLGRELPGSLQNQHSIFSSLAVAEGHLARVGENGQLADDHYRKALEILPLSELSESVGNQRASRIWIYRGLSQLGGESRESLSLAVSCFDRSIKLREDENARDAESYWSLSAAWMNRGEALSKLGGYSELQEVIQSNRKAEEALSFLDITGNVHFRIRLALTWINRGEARTRLAEHSGGDSAEKSIKAFENAVELLRPRSDQTDRILAIVLTNLSRARFLLTLQPELAENEAREAISICNTLGLTDHETIQLSITSRITLCRILAAGSPSTHATEITDLAEEGLAHVTALIKPMQPIPTALDHPSGELFLCGAESYRQCLPEFLTDYILDHLDPDRNEQALASSSACHEAAVRTLWQGIAELKANGFSEIGSKIYEDRVARESEWQTCRERLASIRSVYFEV